MAEPQGLTASVLIGTYNRRAFLLRTLEGLDRQSALGRFEVIVAVDGSTDGTVQALESGSWRFPLRWTVAPNAGIAAARNRAARESRNPVLIVLDDDMPVMPEFVAAHLAAHQAGRVLLVHGPYPLAPMRRPTGAALLYERTRARELVESSAVDGRAWTLWGGNFSVRRETWDRVRGFDESFRDYGGEDTDFGLRVAALGIPFLFEAGAGASHLHVVRAMDFRRRAFSEGRAVVRVARKHGLPLSAFAGGSLSRPIDRALAFAWRTSRPAASAAGGLATGGLWLADRIGWRALQVPLARLVRRIQRVGGMTTELFAERPRDAARPQYGSVRQ
jgi:GT2 family glycosyltransferase